MQFRNYLTAVLIALLTPISSYAQGGGIICSDTFDLYTNDDPIIFETDWFLDGFTGTDFTLSLSNNGTNIGNLVLGVTPWNDAAIYAGQTLSYLVTDNTTGISCFGSFTLFYNPLANCIVRIPSFLTFPLGISKDLNIDFFDFINLQTSCVKDYSVTFTNTNGTFGPAIIDNMTLPNGTLFIDDGASIATNKTNTTIIIEAVDNPINERYTLDIPVRRLLNWQINWVDNVMDTRTYESASIQSTSQISGGGHRIYSACQSGLPNTNLYIELLAGFEVAQGTSFTALATP